MAEAPGVPAAVALSGALPGSDVDSKAITGDVGGASACGSLSTPAASEVVPGQSPVVHRTASLSPSDGDAAAASAALSDAAAGSGHLSGRLSAAKHAEIISVADGLPSNGAAVDTNGDSGMVSAREGGDTSLSGALSKGLNPAGATVVAASAALSRSHAGGSSCAGTSAEPVSHQLPADVGASSTRIRSSSHRWTPSMQRLPPVPLPHAAASLHLQAVPACHHKWRLYQICCLRHRHLQDKSLRRHCRCRVACLQLHLPRRPA